MFNSGYCRLCGEIKLYSNLSVIKNEDEYSKNLCYQISQCFQIQISDDDKLPKTICSDCCTQTNVTYEFFHKVQRAQEFLRNVVCNPLSNYSVVAFIQPVTGLVTNENNIEELIETKVKNDTGAEQDTQNSDSDELWDYESSTDSINVQSSSTSKVLEENIKKTDKQPQRYRAGKIKNEINSNEISGLQSDDANKVQSSEKNKVTRKRKRNKKKIRESDQEICEELKDYTWTCNVCLDKFTTRQNLIDHYRQEHNKPVEYWCAECRRTLGSYTVFVQHVQRHANDPKFCCEECGKNFYQKRYLTQHVKYFHGRVQLKCDMCDKVYRSLLGLKKHKEYHIPDNPDAVTFPCKICHKKLLSENDLIEHEKIHDESNKHFTCEQCGSRFRTKVNLKTHIENLHVVYSEDQYVQCPVCPSKFKYKRQLTRHKRIVHFPTKIYTCETCGKRCKLYVEYKKHLMIHTGERPFKCEHCDKSFRQQEGLKIHNRQHTGEKPYSCSECNHYFSNSSNYIKHMRSKHGVTSIKNLKKNTNEKTVS